MAFKVLVHIIIGIYGIIVGSFLNVCIYRIPRKENFITKRSHCMSCQYQLQWYDLVPVFSWVLLKGKCRKCGKRISVQYPIIESLNGILWVLTFFICGMSWDALVCCALLSCLLVLSVIDWRTYEIPFGINVVIFILGLVMTILHREAWLSHVIGFFAVSVLLLLIVIASKGRAMGGGDVKLMAVCGLLLGWKLIIVAFLFGCLYGSVIHLIRMRISKEGSVLAMGPYLSAGVLTAIWFGEPLIQWYLRTMM